MSRSRWPPKLGFSTRPEVRRVALNPGVRGAVPSTRDSIWTYCIAIQYAPPSDVAALTGCMPEMLLDGPNPVATQADAVGQETAAS